MMCLAEQLAVRGGPINLDGIALDVQHCLPEYLGELWSVMADRYPQLIGMLGSIQERLGREPQVQGNGGALDVSLSLIDREWYDSEDNESDVLFRYLASHSLFDGIRSAAILGAGTCRLADYLAASEKIDSVVCVDLNWFVLFFGRALMQGRIDLLPPASQRDRVVYHVDRMSTSLVRASKRPAFKPPLARNHDKVTFVVRNLFYAGPPFASDVVCIPFLLDEFAGDRLVTLLIRICQQLVPGQRLLILMSCSPRRKRDKGRDPASVVHTLKSLGYSIDFMDLAKLPYTFSYSDYSHYQTTWNTLVVRARRDVTPGHYPRVAVLRMESMQDALSNDIRAAQPAPGDELAVWDLCKQHREYNELAGACAVLMGPRRFEDAFSFLCYRGMVELHPRSVPARPGDDGRIGHGDSHIEENAC